MSVPYNSRQFEDNGAPFTSAGDAPGETTMVSSSEVTETTTLSSSGEVAETTEATITETKIATTSLEPEDPEIETAAGNTANPHESQGTEAVTGSTGRTTTVRELQRETEAEITSTALHESQREAESASGSTTTLHEPQEDTETEPGYVIITHESQDTPADVVTAHPESDDEMRTVIDGILTRLESNEEAETASGSVIARSEVEEKTASKTGVDATGTKHEKQTEKVTADTSGENLNDSGTSGQEAAAPLGAMSFAEAATSTAYQSVTEANPERRFLLVSGPNQSTKSSTAEDSREGEASVDADAELEALAVTVRLEQLAQLLTESMSKLKMPAGSSSTKDAVTGANKAHNTEEQDTGEQNAGKQRTETQDNEAQNTEMKNSDVSIVEVSETKVNGTETKVIEVTDAKLDTKIHGTEATAADTSDIEVKNSGITDIKATDSAANDIEMKDVEVTDVKMKDVEMKASRVEDAEVNDTEVKDTEVKDIDVKDAVVNEKKSASDFTGTLPQSQSACCPLAELVSQSESGQVPLLPSGDLPAVVRPPPGFGVFPPINWPNLAYLATWDGPSSEPLTPDRTQIAERAAGRSPLLAAASQRQNGATSKNRKRSRGSSQDTTQSSAQSPSASASATVDPEQLCRGKPSAKKLAAALSAFQRKSAVACAAARRGPRPPSPHRWEPWVPAERRQVRSGMWWRRHLQQSVRQRGRIGTWFDRRFERGEVIVDPPPPANYTGFSTFRASDLQSLDPAVFGRRQAISLGMLWTYGDFQQAPPSDRNPRDASSPSKSRRARDGRGRPGHTPPPTARDRQRAQAVMGTARSDPEPAASASACASAAARPNKSPRKDQQQKTDQKQGDGEDTTVAITERSVDVERSADAEQPGDCEPVAQQELETLNSPEARRVRLMEELTERHLQMGGSLGEILNMVNNPHEVLRAALEMGEVVSVQVVRADESAVGGASQDTSEVSRHNTQDNSPRTIKNDGKKNGDTPELTAVTDEPRDGTSQPLQDIGQCRQCRQGGQDDAKETTSHQDNADKTTSTVEEQGACGGEELSAQACGGEGLSGILTVEMEVLEATAMELDDERVFTSSEQPEHFESLLSDIDLRMQRARETSDLMRRERTRVAGEVERIRQTLPQMDRMFASLRDISDAVLSAAKSRESPGSRTLPAAEMPSLLSVQQAKPGEQKPAKQKRKSSTSKRSKEKGNVVSPKHAEESPGQQKRKYEDNPTDEERATPSPENIARPSPPASRSGDDTSDHTASQPAAAAAASPPLQDRSVAGCATAAAAAAAAAASSAEGAQASGGAPPPGYPCAVGPVELRRVPGLPPRGKYVRQYLHLKPLEEEDFVRSETGEERTDILSPIGRLAWAMPHRFMSSKQLVEVHALLRSEETTEELRTMDALRFVEDSGGQYLSYIHQFFQCGCDRRYHHVALSGRSMALSRIPSCEMVDYLRSNQWRWPALVSPNTFLSGRGSGDGVAPNAYRTNAELEGHMQTGDMFRVGGVTAYIRSVVRFICEELVCRLERRKVSCPEEREAVSSLITVLLHRWHEATEEPAGIILMYSLHNDSLLEGEMRHTNRYVTLRCESHAALIGCASWSCKLWLWMLYETCRVVVEGEQRFIQLVSEQQAARAPPVPGRNTRPRPNPGR